jgi:hypothetical protein
MRGLERARVNGKPGGAEYQQHQKRQSDTRRPTHFPSDGVKARRLLSAQALWRKEEGKRKCLLAGGVKAV